MKTLILYKTKWGSTKEYCDYIYSNITNADIFSIDDFNISTLGEYNKVVIGSRVMTGKIQAVDFLVKNWNALKDKKIFLFAVGLLIPESRSSKKGYELIPAEIRNYIQFIKIPGKVDITKLNFVEKLLYKMVKSEKGEAEMFKQEFKLENTQPIIDFFKQN